MKSKQVLVGAVAAVLVTGFFVGLSALQRPSRWEAISEAPAFADVPGECRNALTAQAQATVEAAPRFLTELRDPQVRTPGEWWAYPLSERRSPAVFDDLTPPITTDRARLVSISLLYRDYLTGIVGVDQPGLLADQLDAANDACRDVTPVARWDLYGAAVMDAATEAAEPEAGVLAESLIGLGCAEDAWLAERLGGEGTLEDSLLCSVVADHLNAAGRPLEEPK